MPQTADPTGIPDPNHPGYDTGGFWLGNTEYFGGGATGENADPAVAAPPPPSPPPGPDPSVWSNLSQQTFGSMPSVGAATPPPFQYDPFTAPAPFQLPSWEDVVKSDPGIDFGINRGEQALQQSAAARGTLNTGGTLQDIIDYGRNAATQGYGGAANRALGVYQTNYNDALQNYVTGFGSALTKYNTNYGTNYLTPFNQLMQQYQQGVGNQAQLFNQQFQTATA